MAVTSALTPQFFPILASSQFTAVRTLFPVLESEVLSMAEGCIQVQDRYKLFQQLWKDREAGIPPEQ